MSRLLRSFGPLLMALALVGLAPSPALAVERPSSEHEVYFGGSNYELNVYRQYGREDGKTLLIIGGIQGNEPGGFMAADLFSELSLKKGNLIVVPRANLKSIILGDRGADGDMNRRFDDPAKRKEMDRVVARLKELMAEADLFLHLHDGWGFHYPEHVSKWRNPQRYGQSIITDADSYACQDGTELDLKGWAKGVLEDVNAQIDNEKHHLHYFNTRTWEDDTPYPEMKKTATWYALRHHCLPAFGVEASKHLPSLETKVRHHNYVIHAFMDRLGIVPQNPRLLFPEPRLSYAVINVNGQPRTLEDGDPLWVKKGDQVAVTHVEANYDRGVSCDVAGYGGLNDLGKPIRINGSTRIVVRKDDRKVATIPVRLNGHHSTEHRVLLARVDGEKRVVPDGGTLQVDRDASLKLIESFGDGRNEKLPKLNFKGWVPREKGYNDGDDRGYTIPMNGGRLWQKYSRNGQGRMFPVVATNGEDEELARFWVRIRD